MEEVGSMNAAANPMKPKRGRPSAARVNAIDRAIISIARQQFLTEGYDAVAMEQVAAVARVSKGTLYARHPSKEALFNAVIAATIKEWSDEAAQRDHLLTDDIEQRLRHHARTIAASLQRPDVLAIEQLVLSVRSRFPELAATIHENGYRYIVDLIAADLIAAGKREGRVPRDPEAVARMLVAGLSGYQIQEQGMAGGGEGIEDFAQRLVDVMLSGRAAW